MVTHASNNKYAQLLKKQGNYVITIGGIDWYDYGGFMLPAYLPHCCPEITPEMAKEVVRISGRPFARWTSQFGKVRNSEWWYVLKRGMWAIEDIKDKKKRWMIRQGKKHFTVRPLTFDEVVSECPNVAQSATVRYKGRAEIESQEVLEKRVNAAQMIPGVLEYIGCFHGDTLAGFSENYIQDNAVWLVSIRYDPAFLNKYLSYGLIDGILNHYLNGKKMDYVLDGWRSIHHRTEFQDHLMRVFGFVKEYAVIKIVYSAKFRMVVNMAYPFRNAVWFFCDRWVNSFMDNARAVLRQEDIRRACKKQKTHSCQ